jgi:hypothetical protein
MRLVMIYIVSDGFTFNCTETVPIEYESAEAALVKFEELLIETKSGSCAGTYPARGKFVFADKDFNCDDFYYMIDKYTLPEFLTVDEWFNRIS